MAGRPIILTPELQDQIVKAVHVGAYIETAAASAGIHKSTLYDWMKRGAREKRRMRKNPRAKMKKKEAPFVAFSDAVQKAMAEAELLDLAVIAKASKRTWQAAAWRLERKYPERYGRRDRHEITTPRKRPVQVQHGLTDETVDVIKRKIFGLDDDQ